MREPQNFRDVGATINGLLGRPYLREKVFYRGGKFLSDTALADVGNPATIVNLRGGPDPAFEGVTSLHFATPKTLHLWGVATGEINMWLRTALNAISTQDLPIYLHCSAGREATGSVVGAVLTLLGVEAAKVLEEYQLSEGPLKTELILAALDLFGQPSFLPSLRLNEEGLKRLLA